MSAESQKTNYLIQNEIELIITKFLQKNVQEQFNGKLRLPVLSFQKQMLDLKLENC